MKPYTFFNICCVAVSGVFLSATLFLWFTGIHAATNTIDSGSFLTFISDQELKNNHAADIAHVTPPSSTPVVTSSEAVVEESTLVEQPLPPSVTLAVPFTSQAPEKNWEQPWQDACEEAAILMMDAYYEGYGLSPLFAKDEIIKMVAFEDARDWGLSIEIEKIQEIFTAYLKYGIGEHTKTPKIIENPTIEQIKRLLATGNPVLVVANGKTLPNPHFQNGGPEYHALVIRGYTEDTFITNDPGTQFGENFVYKQQDLMNAIRDWNDGDVEAGRRVVLVIE